jgi:hypothetical protein
MAAAAVLVVEPDPADGLDVRVQGRSELDARVVTAGTRIIVQGKLRDDLGKPLPQRTIGIALFDGESDQRIEGRGVQTDRRGEFRSPFEVMPGQYRITLRFESTSHVTGTVFEETVAVERQPVSLDVRAPELVHGDGASVQLDISASIEGVGVELPVEVRQDGELFAETTLDENGRGSVEVGSRLEAGTNAFEVVVPAGGTREKASAGVEIRRVDEMSVDAEVAPVFERLQRGAAVDGVVSGESGPIEGLRVRATLTPVDKPEGVDREQKKATETGELVGTAETDGEGQFHIFYGRENLPDGEWRASVQITPEVGASIERDVGTFTIDRSFSRLVINGAIGLAALVLLLVASREVWDVVRAKLEEMRRRREQTRRRERAFDEEETLEAVPVAADEVEQTEAGDRRLQGYVWDGWDETRVEGARLELRASGAEEPADVETTDAQGEFAFDELSDGSFELVITADYYVRGRFSFEIPHDGALAHCRFELVPVPLKIRRLYQSLIELARGEDLWGELSPREIRSVVAGVLETGEPGRSEGKGAERFVRRIRRLLKGDDQPATPREFLEALTDIVEETYFGPRRYDEETWRLARRIALRLREELEGGDA